jgi:CheY-like chemotaxis protein
LRGLSAKLIVASLKRRAYFSNTTFLRKCMRSSNFNHILPIYHPTTVVFLDDQSLWLMTLDLHLPDELSFKCFHDQDKALKVINQIKKTTSPFSNYRNREYPLENSHTINFDLNYFSKALSDPERFSDISVVVVDYHMPGMNGLDVCKKISDRNIRRIMLTGAANESIAIEAFNDGVIDGFIKKHEKNVIQKLLPMIWIGQQEYFNRTNVGIDVLKNIRLQFLHNANFVKLFHSICQERNIIEHYVTANPDGVFMLDSKANVTLLAVFTEDDLRSQYEVACDQNAPEQLLSALKSREYIFWHGADGFYISGCVDWQSCLYPAQYLDENSGLSYALIDHLLGIAQPNISPYCEYLEASRLNFML